MRIGVLTGGGDVPGLNPCMKAVVNRGTEEGLEVIGFRRGWAGPLNYNPALSLEENSDWALPLTPDTVRPIDRTGGTFLHTSRTNPGRVRPQDLPEMLADTYPIEDGQETVDCTPHVLEVMESLGIDAMVPIGGDDTLSYGVRMHEEGMPVVAIPKTMDNDVFGTDYCIGFSTAVTRSVLYIDQLRTVAGSHERIAFVELFGRNCGQTALFTGYLAGVDRVLLPEVPFDVNILSEMVIKDRKRNPSNYAIVVVSEGAIMKDGEVLESGEKDAYGHRKLGGINDIVAEEVKELTGINVLKQRIAYLMRSGVPDSLDRMVAISYGILAVQEIKAGRTGQMVSLQNGNYTTVRVETCVQGKKLVDVEQLYETTAYRPRIRHPLGKPMFLY
jgi:6-phosphofructokinase 1